MPSSTWRATFGPLDYPLLTTALENYAAQQRCFADQLDSDDGQLDHARRILLQQAEAAADLSKRIDTAFTVPTLNPPTQVPTFFWASRPPAQGTPAGAGSRPGAAPGGSDITRRRRTNRAGLICTAPHRSPSALPLLSGGSRVLRPIQPMCRLGSMARIPLARNAICCRPFR
jgi:hypothetical protein